MGYCVNCGAKIENESLFCVQCGTPLKGSEENPSILEGQVENKVDINQSVNEPAIEHENKTTKNKKQQEKKKFGKGKKILISIAALLVISIGVAYYVLSNIIYNPMNQIEEMNSAYKQGNNEAFYKQFNIPEGTVGNADSFMELIEEIGWDDLEEQLVDEIDRYKDGKRMDSIQYEDRDLIDIKTNPVLFGLFDTFEFSIVPLEVEIYSPIQDVNITIDNVSITTKKEEDYQSVGEFLPGEYKYSYSYEKGYVPVKGEGTVNITAQDSKKTQINLDFDNWTDVDLYSDVKDAVLYVDGKSTEKTVEEINTLFPVIYNDSVEIYAVGKDEDGKEIKSDVYKLNDSVIYFEFEHLRKQKDIDEMKEELKELYQTYRDEFETANNNADFSYVSKYFADGSQIQKDYKKFVEDHKKIDDYKYTFLTNDVTSIDAKSDTEFVLKSTETFEYYSSDDGTIFFERDKEYTIEVKDDHIYFTEIKDLNTKKTKID